MLALIVQLIFNICAYRMESKFTKVLAFMQHSQALLTEKWILCQYLQSLALVLTFNGFEVEPVHSSNSSPQLSPTTIYSHSLFHSQTRYWQVHNYWWGPVRTLQQVPVWLRTGKSWKSCHQEIINCFYRYDSNSGSSSRGVKVAAKLLQLNSLVQGILSARMQPPWAQFGTEWTRGETFLREQ